MSGEVDAMIGVDDVSDDLSPTVLPDVGSVADPAAATSTLLAMLDSVQSGGVTLGGYGVVPPSTPPMDTFSFGDVAPTQVFETAPSAAGSGTPPAELAQSDAAAPVAGSVPSAGINAADDLIPLSSGPHRAHHPDGRHSDRAPFEVGARFTQLHDRASHLQSMIAEATHASTSSTAPFAASSTHQPEMTTSDPSATGVSAPVPVQQAAGITDVPAGGQPALTLAASPATEATAPSTVSAIETSGATPVVATTAAGSAHMFGVTQDTSCSSGGGFDAVASSTAATSSSSNHPLAANAAIALDLQAQGATFGNGGNETTAMTLGNTGSGITVGILSDSFNTSGNADTMATDIANGYLPAGTDDIKDSSGGTDEGRAMAQIVHEIAPGANIDFETANSTQQDFANNILDLANEGCKVIVDDELYYAEPDYQEGVIAQAIDTVEKEGVVYLNAAQNNAEQGYEGAFSPGQTFTYGGQTFTADNFSTGGSAQADSLLKITTGDFGAVVNLEWVSPAASSGGPGATSDLALFVTNSAGVVQSMDGNGVGNSNVIGSDPFQQVYVPANETYYLEVGLLSGSTAPADFKITADDDAGEVTLGSEASNINDGTTSGHDNAAGTIAVGAAYTDNTPAYGQTPPVSESYSSGGPEYVYYGNCSTRLKGRWRLGLRMAVFEPA